MIQTETEKITDFTINMVTVSTELKTHYPKLTDYEILKLSLDLQKNVVLDDLNEHLNFFKHNFELILDRKDRTNNYLQQIVSAINNLDNSF